MNFSSVSIDSDSHENTMMHANELYLNYIYIIFACIDLYVMAVARKVISMKDSSVHAHHCQICSNIVQNEGDVGFMTYMRCEILKNFVQSNSKIKDHVYKIRI
jgi:ribosomal protein S18